MDFNKKENYLKVIRAIFKDYAQIHQTLIQDFHEWLDGLHGLPYTKELRQILKRIREEEKVCGE